MLKVLTECTISTKTRETFEPIWKSSLQPSATPPKRRRAIQPQSELVAKVPLW
jgi:hypothetical protein